MAGLEKQRALPQPRQRAHRSRNVDCRTAEGPSRWSRRARRSELTPGRSVDCLIISDLCYLNHIVCDPPRRHWTTRVERRTRRISETGVPGERRLKVCADAAPSRERAFPAVARNRSAMLNLTPEGLRIVIDIARRHGVSVDAALTLLGALA